MRTATDHKAQMNRCAVCGHRLTMHLHAGTGCAVVTGEDLGKPSYREAPCRCRVGA
jgi:hypothetical protein